MRNRRGRFAIVTVVLTVALGAPGATAVAGRVKKPKMPPCSVAGAFTPKTNNWVGIKEPEWPAGDVFIVHQNEPLGDNNFDGTQAVAFRAHPNDANTLYITNGATVFKSKDGGCHWDKIFAVGDLPGPSNPTTRAFLITDIQVPEDPKAQDRVYLVFGEKHWMYQDLQIYVARSNDGGKTWEVPFSVPAVGQYPQLEIAPSNPDVLYLSTQKTLVGPIEMHKSTDGGKTWTLASVVDARANDWTHKVFGIDPLDENELWFWGFVATSEFSTNLRHSTDGGATWQMITLGTKQIGALDIYHVVDQPARLIANGYRIPLTFRSDDGGVTWYAISSAGSTNRFAHGDGPDKVFAANENENSSPKGVWRYDPNAARGSGYAWVDVTPPMIDTGCYSPVSSVQITRTNPAGVYVAAKHYCSGDYPVSRYLGRL